MAEEADSASTRGGETSAAVGAAPAVALASAGRETADRFLDRQSALADLQMENLRLVNDNLQKQDEFELSHLRFRRFSDYARFALEIAGGLVVLLIVSALGAMVWSAAQDHDLVVDAFSVPADMAQTGMTGSVLAARVLDKLGKMQSDTFSIQQSAASIHGNDTESVRVEIPDTGVSIGELNRYLRGWLGSESHITGDLVRTPAGLALTVRYGSHPGVTVAGKDLDALAQSAAEHVFAAAQPVRYVDYLAQQGRFAEAENIISALAVHGDAHQRSLAYASWASIYLFRGDMRGSREKALIAVRLEPTNPSGLAWLSASEDNLSHEEASVQALDATLRNTGGATQSALDAGTRNSLPTLWTVFRDEQTGDFAGAMAALTRSAADGLPYYPDHEAEDSAQDHDLGEAHRMLGNIPTMKNGHPNTELPFARLTVAVFAEDWPGAVHWGEIAKQSFAATPERLWEFQLEMLPPFAYAMARNGDIVGAEALIEKTSLDCDDCVRKRGRIAAIRHDWAGAARWFALVSARSPSIPFADTDWGLMLLQKGDPVGAIAKFQSANRKSPGFADPLEMWGEALVRDNRSDLALAKFAGADKYAPNWGRLHLKWGEALLWSGDKAGAVKQFAFASGFDLSTAEKAELTRVSHGR